MSGVDWIDRWNAMQRFRIGGAACHKCRYWQFRHYWDELEFIDHLDNPSDSKAECRRHAPRVHAAVFSKIGNTLGAIAWATEETANIEHSKEDDSFGTDYHFECTDQDEIGEWPTTGATDWCGDFLPGRIPMPPEDEAWFRARDEQKKLERAAERAVAEPK